MFRSLEEQEREEELRRALGLGGSIYDSVEGDIYGTGSSSTDLRRPEPQFERNFFDRLFAPFEAPQQTLFALTEGRGLWDSLSHGARYFNPWSNEERIDSDEIRETLFGEQADGWVKTTSNLAISLLFDPLLLAPAAKVLGVSGRAARMVDRAVNPAALLTDAAIHVSKEYVGPASRTAFTRVFGEGAVRNVDRLGVEVMQAVANRFHGVNPELADVFRNNQTFILDLHGDGVRALKTIDRLTPEVRPLLTEALESSDVWARTRATRAAREGAEMALDPKVERRLLNFDQRVLDSGADPDLFWQAYERARDVDDRIGRYLLESGAISKTKFAEMEGTHLRRMYQAFESPELFAERMDILANLGIPDRVSARSFELRRAMTAFSDEVFNASDNLAVQLGVMASDAPAAARYFDDTGKFHAKNFTDDLMAHIRQDSTSTLDELFTHIKTNMMGDMDLPGSFYARIANWLTHGTTTVDGSAARAAALRRGRKNVPTYTYREFRENPAVVSDRVHTEQWYADALGEILDPGVRIAGEVLEAGGLVAARRLFDQVSGARRISGDDMERIAEATQAGFTSPEARQILGEVAERFGMNADEFADTVAKLQKTDEGFGVGTQLGSRGSAWASETIDDAAGFVHQIPNDSTYGTMAGMWVDAPTAALMRTSHARDTIRSTQGKAISKLGDLYRDGVGMFKFFKAVFDPTGQARNFAGAGLLADLGGMGWNFHKNVHKVGEELTTWIRTGEMGHYMSIAERAGVNIWKQDLFSVELSELSRRHLTEAIGRELGTQSPVWQRPFTAILNGINEVSRRIPGVSRAAAAVGERGGGVVDMAATSFQLGDQWWKLGMFIDKYEGLAGAWVKQGKELTEEVANGFARQAASLAQQSIFNYADVPWLVDFVRKWGIVPFATFPFKAAPFVAKTLYENPWRVLKYDRLTDGANEYFAGSPEDAANEIDGLPRHMREQMVIKLPWNDGQGRPQYLDLSYYMPWSVIRDLQEGMEWDGGFRSGVASPPLMTLIDAIRHNQDNFGRPIVELDKGRSSLQNFEAVANYISSFMLPSWVPSGSRASSIGRAMMATASHSAEPVKWQEMLGLGLRSPGGALMEMLGGDSVVRENTLTADGRVPQGNTQATREGLRGLLSSIPTSLLGGASASVPGLGRREEVQQRQANRSQIQREIANIRSDRSLSTRDKARRIQRLIRELRDSR